MFAHSYQSGNSIEIYNTQSNFNLYIDKELIKNWKYSGKIAQEYDSQAKGYVTILNSGGASKMQIPSNDKQSLGIVQCYIVFQLYLFSPKLFTIEISVSDTSKVIYLFILDEKTTNVFNLFKRYCH